MNSMTVKITEALDEELSSYEKNKWVLTIKMNTYIACTLTEVYEKQFNKPTTEILTGKVSSIKTLLDSIFK